MWAFLETFFKGPGMFIVLWNTALLLEYSARSPQFAEVMLFPEKELNREAITFFFFAMLEMEIN